MKEKLARIRWQAWLRLPRRSFWFIVWLIVHSWKWWKFLSRRRRTSTRLYGVTPQEHTYKHTDWWEGFFKYAVEMGSVAMIYIPSSIKAVPKLRKLVAGFLPQRPEFELGSGHVEFVVDKESLGQVDSDYFGFPCQFSFNRLLPTHHLSSGAGAIGQLVAHVPSVLSLTPPQEVS
jgi:hypothetical protein